MFAVSGLYNYATSSSSSSKSTSNQNSTPSATRVKRHPNNRPRTTNSNSNPPSPNPDSIGIDDQPPPSYASVASSTTSETELAKRAIVDAIIKEPDLYKVLGVEKKAKVDEIRRGFLKRSRVCHPDKFPNYPPSTLAFQRVSFAYETLSKPNSRRIYDVSGRHDLAAAMNGNGTSGPAAPNSTGMDGGDETLNGVLYSVFCEFMEGDFEMIRVLVSAMNEGNPGLNLGEEAVENLEGAFHKMRDFMLNGKKYLSIIRFELIRLYEIQHSLRQLSYFDVFGRLRLTLHLAKVTIGIPLAIDQAMKEGDQDQEDQNDDQDDQDASGRRKKNSNRDQDQDEDQDEESESEEDEEDDDDWRRRPNWKSTGRQAQSDEFGIAPEDDEDEEETLGEKVRRERREIRREMRERERKLRRMNLKNGRASNKNGRNSKSSETASSPNSSTSRSRGGRDERGDQKDSKSSTTSRTFDENRNGNERRKSRSFRQGEAETSDDQQDQDQEDEDEEDESEDGDEDDDDEEEEEIKNKKKGNAGLFGPTTSRLLGGVVKVLETSESWVPGKRNPDQ